MRGEYCEECGGQLGPSHRGNTRYCSPKCRYKARDRAKNPEAERARSRAYYAANREAILAKRRKPAPAPRTCAVCGETFEPYWSGKPQKYCSSHCRNRRPRATNYRTAEYRAQQRARDRREYFRERRRKKAGL
jgi:hypothetical protein